MSGGSVWKIEFPFRAVVTRKPQGQQDAPGLDPVVTSDMEPAPKKKVGVDEATISRKQLALRSKALEPLKQVGFMCFMLWMSGNTLQLFSIMMMVSCIYSPFQAIANVTTAFPHNKDVDVLVPRVIYCLVYLAQLGFAAYKLDQMGLLPTHASDFASVMPTPRYLGKAVPPLDFS